MNKIIMAAVLAGAFVTSATGQEFTVDQSRLYVSDPAACGALEDKGVDAWLDMDFTTFSFTDGIQSMEFHCNVFDLQSRPNSNFSFVSAICELPGEIYPDTWAVTPFDERTIQVVSSYDSAMIAAGVYEPTNEGTSPGARVYHRCDNLSEIPVD